MTAESTVASPEIGRWLARGSLQQFISLALQVPTAETIAQMRSLCSALSEPLAARAQRILEMPRESWEPEFFSVLGPAGCPVCESSYERAAGASRGPLLAHVAAFYDAFGYAPAELQEVPDHAAVEFGFTAFLAVKVAFALHEQRIEHADVARAAFREFHEQHLGAWFGRCADAMRATGSEQYGLIAELATDALTDDHAPN